MAQIISSLVEWIIISRGTIWIICFLIYCVVVVRYFIFFLSLYNVSRLSEISRDIRAPIDVYVGLGASLLGGCLTFDLFVLAQDSSVPAATVAAALNLFIIFFGILPLAMPLRFLLTSLRQIDEEITARTRNKS